MKFIRKILNKEISDPIMKPLPNYRSVDVFMSHLHNKILIQPVYQLSTSGSRLKEEGTVLAMDADETEIGLAIINGLNAFEVVSQLYWNTIMRNQKQKIRSHNLLKIKTIKKFEREYLRFTVTDRFVEEKNEIRSAGTLTIKAHPDPKTHISLHKSCSSAVRKAEEIGSALNVIYGSYVTFFDPFKENEIK